MMRRHRIRIRRRATLRRRAAFFVLMQTLEPEEQAVDPYTDRVDAPTEPPRDAPPEPRA